MDETILFPSPNWYKPSGLAVSSDEWLIYGGPSKSLCVLEPLPTDYDTIVKGYQGYTAHVVNRAHPEKIVCVDLCPEWPEKRNFLTGSSDGAVKQWSLEGNQKTLKIKPTHSHEIHVHEKEEVIGVGYCKNGYAVTVGSFGNIVKWDLNSNVAKSFNHVLKTFKPTCMACSPHIHMHIAIGTRQGVLFVLDLNGSPRIIYKVRGQDDEILQLSWCPQYEVAVRKSLKESDKRKGSAAKRMQKIRQEPEDPETMKLLDERLKNSQTTDQPVLINEKLEPIDTQPMPSTSQEVLDESGIGKTLPEDSFDEVVVQEDDMFDIYKDHEADEFGHKKYEPHDVLVKVPIETVQEDYLIECQKLKDEIMKRKVQSDTTIGELVEAMDKTKLEAASEAQAQASNSTASPRPEAVVGGKITKGEVESSVHIHKHLLATIGKQGSIRVWSKSGKLVGSCAVYSAAARGQARGPALSTTLLWAQPDSLLIADGKSQLLTLNPLKIDCKNKFEWAVVQAQQSRGIFALASPAPRVQTLESAAARRLPAVWAASVDRSLVRFDLATGESVAHMTCGGFPYTVRPCPYDANKVAISVGDGTVRVWETDTLPDDDSRLLSVRHLKYWQNVQGKVLVTAWHPEKENVLAFSTAESRVGIIETRGKGDRPARTLVPTLSGGVYSLCWGGGDRLYACGSSRCVLYHTDKPDAPPEEVKIEFEGVQWDVSVAVWTQHGLVVGSGAGAVGLVGEGTMRAAIFLYKKMIHTIEWHPCDTSQYKNLIAVCSQDKVNTVTIVEYGEKDDGSKQLCVWQTLAGHTAHVLQVAWNPHREHQLLSTSQDGTIRVWDVSTGTCTSIFGEHGSCAVCAVWSPRPSLPDVVLSGGGDCCLRLWLTTDHPADTYQEIKHEVTVEKKTKKNKRDDKKSEKDKQADQEADKCESGSEQAVSVIDTRRRHNKKFLMPMIHKQILFCEIRGPRKMLQKYLEKNGGGAMPTQAQSEPEYGLDYIKIFGNINELNDVLDTELQRHEDMGNIEAYTILSVLRGYIDTVIQHAAQRDALDPFLLSIAPCVSFKYWKDVTLLYLKQMDRLQAKGEEQKLDEARAYGGCVFRRVAVLLSLHDVKAAVSALIDARLYRDAYVLSRTRYMDSLAEQTLRLWAQHCVISSAFNLAAVCYIALGDLTSAASALGKSSDEDSLSLAADIAKILGQNTFAGHMEEKRDLIKNKKESEMEGDKDLKELPSRVQLVLDKESREECENETENGASNEDSSDKDSADHKQGETKKVLSEKVENQLIDKYVGQKSAEKTETPEGCATKNDDKTEELLERLPERMEGLMKVSKDVVLNGTHRGDGDTLRNNDVTVRANGKERNGNILEKGNDVAEDNVNVTSVE